MPQEKGYDIDIEGPIKLSANQEWVCKHLDELNNTRGLCVNGVLPSDLIKGALYVIQNRTNNLDWMAQAAHSYREIIYYLRGGDTKFHFVTQFLFLLNKLLAKFGFKSEKLKKFLNSQPNKKDSISYALQILHEQNRADKIAEVWYLIHRIFTNIAHHFAQKGSRVKAIKDFGKLKISVREENFPSEEDFLNLVTAFENTLKASSLDPLKIHEKIDTFLSKKQNDCEPKYLKLLFSLNIDAKRYFFYKADETWLNWLWGKGFLDPIKEKAPDPVKYTRMPELQYLARMAEKDPAKVMEIIREVNISEDTLNLEVINQFLWVIDALPPEHAKMLTGKMRDEKWVSLIKDLKKSGYEFHKIVKTLSEAKEFKALLELAEALLETKTKEELKTEDNSFMRDNPFYLDDINSSGIFEAIANIDNKYAEQALVMTSSIIGKIVKLADRDKEKVFEYEDYLGLYDVDFFTLELDDSRDMSYWGDIKNLAAVLKKLVQKTIGKKCNDAKEAKRLLAYIDQIPTNRPIWRLQLFALSQYPEIFKEELKRAFFKLFKVGEQYIRISGGAEYHQALIGCFGVLEEDDRREYVTKLFEYFGAELEDKKMEEYRKRDGAKILVCIKGDPAVNATVIKTAKERLGIDINEQEYTPKASISETSSFARAVRNRAPVDSLADFTIDDIIEKLKTDWTPEKLNEEFKDDDFLSPRGVEGLGDALKEDFKQRTADYLEKLQEFFNRDEIDAHYLYSILRGIEEMFRNKQAFLLKEAVCILNLLDSIRKEGKEKPFKRENRKDDRSWLVDWITVHKVCADILLKLLEDNKNKDGLHKQSRGKIRDIIKYLLRIKESPSKEDEKTENSEPFHIAINSVRGVAYQAFVMFVQNDGDKLLDDSKEIFKEVLKDDSIAVRFVIGHYLASFYFRGKDFIGGLFPEIFPKDDPRKRDIYLATWEGYLANTLYDKLAKALEEYYEHAITLDPKEYPERKYLKGLDESLGVHMALAFAHLGLEMDDELFKKFWDKQNVTRHHEFISFIGRSCLTRDQAGDEWLKNNKVSKEKLLEFWDWVLKNPKIKEPKIFAGFGYWVNPDKEVLDDDLVLERINKTIEKTGSEIDWEYGFLKRLPVFASKNPSITLEIISNYLLIPEEKPLNFPLVYTDEIKKALKLIYSHDEEKEKVKKLVEILIEKWSSMFWNFKEILR